MTGQPEAWVGLPGEHQAVQGSDPASSAGYGMESRCIHNWDTVCSPCKPLLQRGRQL